MPVETFGFIDDLDSANPPASDGLVGGDDHIRGIKATLKSTFPNITEAVTATAAQINQIASGLYAFAAGSVSAPSAYFVDTTLGFYKKATGVIGIAGLLQGNGAVPTGAICDFLTNTVPTGWYRLNGQAVSRTGDTAALFALLGTDYGVGNGTTTFNLPDFEQSGGLFRRSTGFYGIVQSDTIKSHTASVTGVAADHLHNNSISDTRTWSLASAYYGLWNGANADGGWSAGTQTSFRSAAVQNTGGALSITNGPSDRTITVSGTATYSGGTETRPVNIGVVTCIKG